MIDASALFLHVLAAIGIVGGGVAQLIAGVRLRAATTGRDIVMWAQFVRTLGLVIAGSAVLSLLTGGHLAGAVWTTQARSGFAYPFITLGVIGLVTLAPVGPMVGGVQLRRLIGKVGDHTDGPAPPGVLADARAGRLWGSIHSLVGVGVGLVALMVYKPGWGVGAALLVLSFAAGWAAGTIVTSHDKRDRRTPRHR